MATVVQTGWYASNPVATSPSLMSVKKDLPWSEDAEKISQLMLTHVKQQQPETLDLLGGLDGQSTGVLLDSDPNRPLPCGWERCLDLKTGTLYYRNFISGTKTLIDPNNSIRDQSIGSSPSEVSTSAEPSLHIPKHAFWMNTSNSTNSSLLHNHTESFEELLGSESQSITRNPERTKNATFAYRIIGNNKTCSSQSGSLMHDIHLDLKLNAPTKFVCTTSSVTEESTCRLEEQKASRQELGSSEKSAEQETSLPIRQDPVVQSDHLAHTHISGSQEPSFHSLVQPVSRCSRTMLTNIANDFRTAKREETSLRVGGCCRCLMYVLLSEAHPKCPKCGNTVILDFPWTHYKKFKSHEM